MLNIPRPSPAMLVLRIFLLALAYVIAGRLSLLLAIPPGFVSGILIATPLVCVLFAEPRHFWLGRRVTVGVPLVVSSLIVIAVFIMSSNN